MDDSEHARLAGLVELLAHTLDAYEDAIRDDLAALAKVRGTLFRGDRKQLRLLDLTQALEAVPRARAALARCPAGAELANCVLAVVLPRLRPAVELADLHYQAARKGNAATRRQHSAALAQRDKQIRAAAAKLDPDLTATRKAEIVKVLLSLDDLTVSRIRHILKK